MSIFRKLFRPGSGGPTKGISIVDTLSGRAHVRNPIGNRIREEEIDPDGSFYPYILTNEISASGPLAPNGTLQGVDKEGNIPRYEPDDPIVLNRLFGIVMPDE